MLVYIKFVEVTTKNYLLKLLKIKNTFISKA
jgi:hypothetical protein